MAKRITKRPAKKPATKKATTKKPNTKASKTVNSPAARKRNPKPGSVTKNAKNKITTKKPNTNKNKVNTKKSVTKGGMSGKSSVTIEQAKAYRAAKSNAASKAKKVSRFGLPGKIAAIGTLLGSAAFLKKKKKDPSFGEAFKKARKEKGPNSSFNYKGKKYSTVTKDQVEKAGHSTLRSYLNAGGKKKKTGLTTKRRKTGGPPLRRRR